MATLAAPIITSSTIQELSPGLFAFAYRAVRQREEAEDLVQDTWMSALRTVPSFEGRSSLRTWLVSILRRRIADRFRRARPIEPLEEERHAGEPVAHEERLDAFEDFKPGRLRVVTRVAADGFDRFQGAAPGKDRHAHEKAGLVRRQQFVAPVNRVAKGLLAFRHILGAPG